MLCIFQEYKNSQPPAIIATESCLFHVHRKFTSDTFISGLFTAAHDLKVEWVVIKGVSDFADGDKSKTDSWRPFASTMAASLTAHMLSDPLIFRDWPRYKSKF